MCPHRRHSPCCVKSYQVKAWSTSRSKIIFRYQVPAPHLLAQVHFGSVEWRVQYQSRPPATNATTPRTTCYGRAGTDSNVPGLQSFASQCALVNVSIQNSQYSYYRWYKELSTNYGGELASHASKQMPRRGTGSCVRMCVRRMRPVYINI